MSTGAVFGGFVGIAWSSLWPGFTGGGLRPRGGVGHARCLHPGPLAGLVLVVELTHNGFEAMIPIMAATFLATAVARHVDGYSIYSARLPALG